MSSGHSAAPVPLPCLTAGLAPHVTLPCASALFAPVGRKSATRLGCGRHCQRASTSICFVPCKRRCSSFSSVCPKRLPWHGIWIPCATRTQGPPRPRRSRMRHCRMRPQRGTRHTPQEPHRRMPGARQGGCAASACGHDPRRCRAKPNRGPHTRVPMQHQTKEHAGPLVAWGRWRGRARRASLARREQARARPTAACPRQSGHCQHPGCCVVVSGCSKLALRHGGLGLRSAERHAIAGSMRGGVPVPYRMPCLASPPAVVSSHAPCTG